MAGDRNERTGMHSDDDDQDFKSKSQLKREMQSLQSLGEELVRLNAAQLERIDMPDDLRDAVMLARSITQRGGHKRQLQYIGRLMRDIDAAPIRHALDVLQGRDRESAAKLHRLERWRDRLIAEGDVALGELLEQYPNADRTLLRHWIRDAQHEHAQGKPPQHGRKLFRYLRELEENGQ